MARCQDPPFLIIATSCWKCSPQAAITPLQLRLGPLAEVLGKPIREARGWGRSWGNGGWAALGGEGQLQASTFLLWSGQRSPITALGR